MKDLLPHPFFEQIVAIRRELHRNPELTWEEHGTAEIISRFLDEAAIPHCRGIAGTGVVGEIGGDWSGACVALRADMDALPVQEETGLAFASCVDGTMHACGHDGHMV